MGYGFGRQGDRYEATFSPGEAGLLRDLARQIRDHVASDDRTNPVVARLFPDAHRDDPRVAADYRDLVEGDLRAGKADAARALAAAVGDGGRVSLDADDAEQWLRALNDIRLALGTLLEVTEETYDELDDLDPDDPRTEGLYVYDWLTALQDSLIRALDG